MKTCVSQEGKGLSNETKVIILGKTRELRDKLPKIILKQKISKENERKKLN